jgi:hypothetical protein
MCHFSPLGSFFCLKMDATGSSETLLPSVKKYGIRSQKPRVL